MEVIGYFAAALIGISLGLIGSGGSILTLPILVYLFHIKPDVATSYSLFIVGLSAMVGSIKHYKLGHLQLKSALYFAIPSILSLLFIRKIILPKIPYHLFSLGHFEITKNMVIMLAFSVLMILASVAMIKNISPKPDKKNNQSWVLSLMGVGIGLVTGFLGAGGGFLIIPALLFFGGLNMKQAVGTSLFIIFINSTLGFLGDVINGISIDYYFLLTLSAIAVIGIFIGTALSKKIKSTRLKPIFGWFILIMGCYIIIKEII